MSVMDVHGRTAGRRNGRSAAVLFAVAINVSLAACSSRSADPAELSEAPESVDAPDIAERPESTSTTGTAERSEQLGADELPGDFVPGRVVATDAAGWVIGRSGDASSGPLQLWRLNTDGTEILVAEPPAQEARGVGDLVAVAEARCDQPEDREPMEVCLRARGIVHFYGDDGELVASHDLWERQEVTPGTGGTLHQRISFIRSSADTVWVRSSRTIFEVTADDGVVREVPTLGSRKECPIGGSIYGIGPPIFDLPADEGAVSGEEEDASEAATEQGLNEMPAPFQVHEYRDGEWLAVDGSRRSLPFGHEAVCTEGGIEIASRRGAQELVAGWDPEDGWMTAPSEPGIAADEVVAISSQPSEPSHSWPNVRTILQRSDGELLSRRPDGAYEPTGLSLPVVDDADDHSSPLSAAGSTNVIVGCVRDTTARSAAGQERELTCAAAERRH